MHYTFDPNWGWRPTCDPAGFASESTALQHNRAVTIQGIHSVIRAMTPEQFARGNEASGWEWDHNTWVHVPCAATREDQTITLTKRQALAMSQALAAHRETQGYYIGTGMILADHRGPDLSATLLSNADNCAALAEILRVLGAGETLAQSWDDLAAQAREMAGIDRSLESVYEAEGEDEDGPDDCIGGAPATDGECAEYPCICHPAEHTPATAIGYTAAAYQPTLF